MKMDAARYARLHELFERARGMQAPEREAFVERTRAEDSALGDELASLVRSLTGDASASEPARDARALFDERAIDAARRTLEALDALPHEAGWMPERIANFRLVRRLGAGGMGVVYEAEQEAPRRRVALKMMHPTLGSRERVRRFRLEGELLGRLQHPGIAQVYECGTFDVGRGPQPYFAMELVDGVDLRSYCEREHLSIEGKLALLSMVADAVHHAHERGIVHRDLKPENVLVDAQGAPKVLDFGVARAGSSPDGVATLGTRTGELVGTLAYMAPEQLSAKPELVSARVDVYALGVILYQLLGGRAPLEIAGLPITAAMRVLAHDEPATLSRLDPRLRGDVETIVAKALEKDPARRYASAAALAADIRRHLEHLPISARPATARYRLAKALRRNRGFAVGVTTVILALVLGLSGTLWQAHLAGIERDNAREGALEQARLAQSESAARREADEKRSLADRKSLEARSAEEAALRLAYSANMLAACDALERSQFSSARAFLRAAPEALRGWEHRALSARMDATLRSHERSMKRVDPEAGEWGYQLAVGSDPAWYGIFGRQDEVLLRRWDASTGALLGECRRDPGVPALRKLYHRAQIAHDGVHMALVWRGEGAQASSARYEWWNVVTGELELSTPTSCADPSEPGAVWDSMTPSGSGDVVFCHRGRRAALWTPRSGELRGPFDLPQTLIDPELSNDATRIAMRTAEGEIVLLSAATLEPLARLSGHTNFITRMKFSRDDALLVSGSFDQSVRIWDVASAEPRLVATLPHSSVVKNMTLSPDSEHVASISADRALRIWERRTGRLVGQFGTEGLLPESVAFLSDVEVGALESNGTLRVWRLDLGTVHALEGHASFVYGVVELEPFGLLASCGWDGWRGSAGSLRLWDALTGEPLAALLGPDEFVVALAADSASTRLAMSVWRRDLASTRGRLEVLDLRSGHSVALSPGSVSYSLAFDALGREIVHSDVHGTVTVADAATLRPLRALQLSECTNVMRLAWSPDGRHIAVNACMESSDAQPAREEVLVLDAARLAIEQRFELSGAVALCFSTDSARLAVGGLDGIVRLLELERGTLVAELVGHDSTVQCIAFSPDGTRIASGGLDRNVRLWDATTFDQVARLGGPTDYVRSVTWIRAGERLLGGSGDGSIQVWDLEPARARLEHQRLRAAALARVSPFVARSFDELSAPERVAERIASEGSFDALERQLARQLTLLRALESGLRK
ncbi:MAG: protein kinase [Planctomycetes bacterium]|nr:protein kinase [Planctomycetota bacterium]